MCYKAKNQPLINETTLPFPFDREFKLATCESTNKNLKVRNKHTYQHEMKNIENNLQNINGHEYTHIQSIIIISYISNNKKNIIRQNSKKTKWWLDRARKKNVTESVNWIDLVLKIKEENSTDLSQDIPENYSNIDHMNPKKILSSSWRQFVKNK